MEKRIIDLLGLLKSSSADARLSLIRKNLEGFISEILAKDDDETIDPEMPFVDIGMDSITAVTLKEMLNKSLGDRVKILSTDIFNHPTINQLAEFLENKIKSEVA